MVKLYEGGAYLLHGTEVIADAPDALAAVKSKTGIETTKEATDMILERSVNREKFFRLAVKMVSVVKIRGADLLWRIHGVNKHS